MTILNETQEQLIVSVRANYDALSPVLAKMQEEYEYAVYRAKKPLRDAVDAAQEGGVPMSRIVSEGTDMRYAQKMKAWLLPAECVIERVLDGDVTTAANDTYTEVLETLTTVTRNASDGKFNVIYNGSQYDVAALGPDSDPWATEDSSIPPQVYELITEAYPGFVVLGEDDE